MIYWQDLQSRNTVYSSWTRMSLGDTGVLLSTGAWVVVLSVTDSTHRARRQRTHGRRIAVLSVVERGCIRRQCACTFAIVCLVTLLIFLHSLHLSAQLNVSTSVISSTFHSFLCTGIASLTFVRLMFLFHFFLGRLLVLYFSLVAPAICYLFFLHVVLYVFLVNKWWWFAGSAQRRARWHVGDRCEQVGVVIWCVTD